MSPARSPYHLVLRRCLGIATVPTVIADGILEKVSGKTDGVLAATLIPGPLSVRFARHPVAAIVFCPV